LRHDNERAENADRMSHSGILKANVTALPFVEKQKRDDRF